MIAAGGTAGHVVPALAVADALRARGAEVTFIGGERAEAQLVPAAGYPLHTIAVAGLDRRNPLRAARALVLAVRAFVRARALLGQLRPDAVMGGGGYVSAPVGLAALTRRIPLVLTEADSHLGLANRALAPFARRVCLAFPPAEAPSDAESRATGAAVGEGAAAGGRSRRRPLARRRCTRGRAGGRYRVTGRPIPPPHEDRAAARGRGWGSSRARPACLCSAARWAPARSTSPRSRRTPGPPSTCCTSAGGATTRSSWRCRGRKGMTCASTWTSPSSLEALAAADLVVARAGGSLFEVAAHGRPAILIPYPHAAADHQAANARWMEQGGAAVVMPDGELSAARLARETAALLADPQRMRTMAAAARRLARPDAAEAVAGELLEAARG